MSIKPQLLLLCLFLMQSLCHATWREENIDDERSDIGAVEVLNLNQDDDLISLTKRSTTIRVDYNSQCKDDDLNSLEEGRCLNSGSRFHRVSFLNNGGNLVWTSWSKDAQNRDQLYAVKLDKVVDAQLMSVISSYNSHGIPISVSVIRMRIKDSPIPVFRTLCYDHQSESLLWTQDLLGLDVSEATETGLRIVDDMIIGIGTQLATAISLDDGDVLWLYPLPDRKTIVTSAVDIENESLILSTLGEGLTSISLANGKVNWKNHDIYPWHGDLAMTSSSKIAALCSKTHNLVLINSRTGAVELTHKADTANGFQLGSLNVREAEIGAFDGHAEIWKKLPE